MSYFDFSTDPPVPAHIVPDFGYELLPGWSNLFVLPPAAEWPTIRWRWGNESVPDGTIWTRDYPNPGIPGPNPDQTEVQIYLTTVNDAGGVAYYAWGTQTFDFVTGHTWIYRVDTGWEDIGVFPGGSLDTIADTGPIPIPGGSTWQAITALKPPS